MAFHRKVDALLELRPDIAVICECANPDRLRQHGANIRGSQQPVWVGINPNKGLGVFAFNGHRLELADPYFPNLRYIAPVQVSGPNCFNLLAVWAQNASGGVTRKHQSGPLRQALTKYRRFLTSGPAIVGGDLNSNAIWDKPGWRINHMTMVHILHQMGLVSAYHQIFDEKHGQETKPTHYWRDRRKDGPNYHLDYVFLPLNCLKGVKTFSVESYEAWCGNGLSDHVPLMIDLSDVSGLP